MLRIDWSNPKISLNDFENYLSNYLTSNYDGLLQEGTWLYVRTIDEQVTQQQEADIMSFIYSLNNQPQVVSVQSQPVPPPFMSKIITVGNTTKKLYKRVMGIQQDVQVGDNIIIFPITFAWAKITGVEIINGEALDTASFFVLDSPTGSYSTIPNMVLNKFGFAVNISKDRWDDTSPYDADIYLGMSFKVVYNSQSAKRVGFNFSLHEVK